MQSLRRGFFRTPPAPLRLEEDEGGRVRGGGVKDGGGRGGGLRMDMHMGQRQILSRQQTYMQSWCV